MRADPIFLCPNTARMGREDEPNRDLPEPRQCASVRPLAAPLSRNGGAPGDFSELRTVSRGPRRRAGRLAPLPFASNHAQKALKAARIAHFAAKVGGFCCPAHRALGKKVQGILLPGSPGGRWNPLLLPGGVQPRFCPNNY